MGKRKRAKPLRGEHELHLCFEEVNSGINKLVAGVTHIMPGNGNKKASALTIDFNPRASDSDPLKARLDSIEILLKSIAAGSTVTIYTDDTTLLSMLYGNESETMAERYAKLTESFEDISIRPPSNDDDIDAPKEGTNALPGFDPLAGEAPQKTGKLTHMAMADRHMRQKLNDLGAPVHRL